MPSLEDNSQEKIDRVLKELELERLKLFEEKAGKENDETLIRWNCDHPLGSIHNGACDICGYDFL